MRGLCISFTSSCFLFPVREGSKTLRTGGLKILGLGGGYQFGVGSVLHYVPCIILYRNEGVVEILEVTNMNMQPIQGVTS